MCVFKFWHTQSETDHLLAHPAHALLQPVEDKLLINSGLFLFSYWSF